MSEPTTELPVLAHPTTTDVAAILRARTKDLTGVEVGDFNADTRPTGPEVDQLISLSYDEVTGQSGLHLRDRCAGLARSLIVIRAAMWVEGSYWPEQVRSDRSIFTELAEQYALGIVQLMRCVSGDLPPDGGGTDDPTLSLGFGALNVHGWTSIRQPYGQPPDFDYSDPTTDDVSTMATRVEPGDATATPGEVTLPTFLPRLLTMASKFRSGVSGVEIETLGLRAQVELMNRLGLRAVDARPAWPAVELVLIDAEQDLFSSRDHGKWPRLAETTIATKSRKRLDPRPMHASNLLFKSLTQKKPRARWKRAKKTELRWGTKMRYAFFHQEGRGTPRRAVIDLTPEQSKKASQIVGRYVTYGES